MNSGPGRKNDSEFIAFNFTSLSFDYDCVCTFLGNKRRLLDTPFNEYLLQEVVIPLRYCCPNVYLSILDNKA